MTQKQLTQTPVDKLLQTIDPNKIADESLRQTVEILLNLIEELKSEVKDLRSENQRLRDENNRLKGEQGKPEIKRKQSREDTSNHSSEKERKTPKNHEKGQKNKSIKIDRQEIIKYPSEKLPVDAQFKGYEEVVIQDIKLSTDNVLFRKEKYYSPQTGKTYLAELPDGYEGEFGPGIKALVISLYYGSNMTQSKLLEFLGDIGIVISAGYLSNLLIKNHSDFHSEKSEVYEAGLASSPWQHFDQTTARVAGVNYTTNIVCNPIYTVYFTTEKKDRLTVLKGLQNERELQFLLNPLTYDRMETFQIPHKIQKSLKLLPQETEFRDLEFNTLLDNYLPKLGSQQRTRVLEAAAIAFYHYQTDWPVVQALVCDDAPQFKLLTVELALCWVHEGRHYKKLSPVVAYHQRLLDEFLKSFWDYYRELLAYRDAPSNEAAQKLRSEFWEIFGTKSGYEELDERKRLTAAKMEELLLVLEHPELPLHNNPAELGARTMVLRRNISYGTQTSDGTKAIDTFLSLVATTRKLGISFFEYVRDRITGTENIESLATIIRNNTAPNLLGWSWQTE
jgi:regulator of replication initiation timing